MAKTYIFAIGGTGARVMRSLTMLMAAGVNGLDGPICPIIIDYDKENGDKLRAVESMKRYTEVHKLIYEGKRNLDVSFTDGKQPFFYPEYKELFTNWCWDFNIQENKSMFHQYIDYASIGNRSMSTKRLVDTLYDISNDDVNSELNLNMEVGFQGNPNIGSVVFNELKNSEQFTQAFVNDFEVGDKVIVIGSLFGGTGSSGIPKVVSAIRNHRDAKINTANISVVFVLPYFTIDIEGEISIKSAIFNSKTKAALNYYEKSGLNGMINNIYYVGDKVPTRVKPQIGSKKQKNNAHFVELIAAMAVVHTIAMIPSNDRGIKYKFNSCLDINDGIGIEELIGDTTKWEENGFVKGILHNLINLVYASRFFLDMVLNPEEMKFMSFYNDLKLNNLDLKSKSMSQNKIQDFCAALYCFICKERQNNEEISEDGLWQWLKELHNACHGEHRMKIFKLDCADICDILNGKDFRSNAQAFKIFGNPTKKPILTYELFTSEINKAINPYIDGIHRLSKKPAETYPWIFNDALQRMTESIRTSGDEKLVKIFNLIP